MAAAANNNNANMGDPNRFAFINWAGCQVDADGLPITIPIIARPADLFTRDAADINTFLDDEALTTTRNATITAERARMLAARQAVDDAAQAAADHAARQMQDDDDDDDPIPRRRNKELSVKIPIEPKWTTLPRLDVQNMSTLYPWVREFETLTLKATITDEMRKDFFEQFPDTPPGTAQDFRGILAQSTVDISKYVPIRNYFLDYYGPHNPTAMLLAELAMKVGSVKSTTEWRQLLNACRLELRIAAEVEGIQHSDSALIATAISAYPEEKTAFP